jgi:hypothetical protein
MVHSKHVGIQAFTLSYIVGSLMKRWVPQSIDKMNFISASLCVRLSETQRETITFQIIRHPYLRL